MNPFRTEYERRYAEAFVQLLDAPGERALAGAYELGRAAVDEGLGVLDLAELHQRVLAGAIAGADDPEAVVAACGDFFLEALAAFEMVSRALAEAVDHAARERRQATVLRRLSAFLSDTSLALDAAGSLEEVVQLVAEHAREVVGARWARAALEEPVACVAEAGDPADEPRLAAPLNALDGRRLGDLTVAGKPAGFSALDEALLIQLAQMSTAAIERAQLYSR